MMMMMKKRKKKAEGTEHSEVLERMVASQPIFRPAATSWELVAEFANGENRMPAFLSLYSRGEDALPAVRAGLGHANWQVRCRAVAILANHRSPSARVLPMFHRILAEEKDRKLRRHAEHGVQRYAESGFHV